MSKKLAALKPGQLAEHHYPHTPGEDNPLLTYNKLPQRWQALDPQANHTFVIGETDFAGGHNFLAAAELWLEHAPATATLHFIALDPAPLSQSDLQHVLQQYALQASSPGHTLARELIDNYPALSPGFHRLFFSEQRICLTLIFIDTDAPEDQGLAQLRSSPHPATTLQSFSVDAWFLAHPVHDALLQHIKHLSDTDTTVVSVKTDELSQQQLQAIGFDLQQANLTERHQDLLYGQWQPSITQQQSTFTKPSPPRRQRKTAQQIPWYLSATPHLSPSRHAAIIGGGIAACTTAAALAQRGWRVTVYERHSCLANEGSGNPQGIIYPKLSPQSSPLSRINLSAIQFASRYYQRFWHNSSQQRQYGQQCGVLVLPESEKETAAFTAIANNFKHQTDFIQQLDTIAIENIAGLAIDAATGLYYPQLGWINPPKVCQALLDHPLIHIEQANITALNYDTSASTWQLSSVNQSDFASADTVVLATSTTTRQFQQTKHLPLKAIRGQISIAPSNTGTETSRQLKTVLCGAGYIAPHNLCQQTFGASYNLNNTSLETRLEDHQHNIDLLEKTATGLTTTLQLPAAGQLSGRAALRCTTLDYLPILGQAPNYDAFLEDYADLRRDASTSIPTPGQYWPGLYIHCGLGSRGLGYAPLGAELLASQINGEPPALERDLLCALNPARFIIRHLKRRKI
ncbi:hypothetical protein A9Q89_06830 [Gammaproteobacteria bacterium 53_120_T64]|nr:hypothetical protein A9Q89_06830 [Gammaproteobacteria bacterium 53_120_T64]